MPLNTARAPLPPLLEEPCTSGRAVGVAGEWAWQGERGWKGSVRGRGSRHGKGSGRGKKSGCGRGRGAVGECPWKGEGAWQGSGRGGGTAPAASDKDGCRARSHSLLFNETDTPIN